MGLCQKWTDQLSDALQLCGWRLVCRGVAGAFLAERGRWTIDAYAMSYACTEDVQVVDIDRLALI